MASSSKGGKDNGDDSKHFAPGDVVLGKIKGYPPWPGILVDGDNVPKQKVLASRPGKNFFIVRFFPAADYGFNRAHELRKLHKREIEAYLSDPHKKGQELREAYKLALHPDDWNAEQNQIVKDAEAAGEDEVDMLAEEDEDDEQPKKKKRKAPATETQAKKAKAAKTSSAKIASASQATAAPRKSAGADEAEEEEEMDPETKKVRGWRHSLQRGFLGKDNVIHSNEMESMHKVYSIVEEYDGITPAILRKTKIGKVMRRILLIKEEIPHDDKYKFKERAGKLCDKWTDIVVKSGEAPSGDSARQASAGATNGTLNSATSGRERSESKTAAADESILSVGPN